MTRSPPADDRARIVERAKRYPYEAPRSSFVLAEGRRYDILPTRPRPDFAAPRPHADFASPQPDAGSPPPRPLADLARAVVRDSESGRELALGDLLAPDAGPIDRPERARVLAYGANRTPEALERKLALPGFPPDHPLVVLHARLHGFDVVYSAHLSPYGSVGATLQVSPGTAVAVGLALLTERQLTALDETEPNYTLEQLDGIDLELETGARIDGARSYVSRHGSLVLDGRETALAAIAAEGRRLTARTEPEVLAAVAARLGHRGSLDDFIVESVADPELAAARTRELRRDARSLDWPRRGAPEP